MDYVFFMAIGFVYGVYASNALFWAFIGFATGWCAHVLYDAYDKRGTRIIPRVPAWFEVGARVRGVSHGLHRTGTIARVSTGFTTVALVEWDIDPTIIYPDGSSQELRAFWTLEPERA